ncbi:beta-galactosidase [Flavobacterium zepuense]|uniref:beta-galactosidase n=1 Tax=Flavobacterium zepuense TaxID=2593302 RepID=A0A552V9V5_9FLAO|nr:sugar-binding domain-containing protein [Flavobacterium zepuense]TRW27252.1 beta-galactosidase [Flavobacterium zepuense]
MKHFFTILMLCLLAFTNGHAQQSNINLAGNWQFQTDPLDKGIPEKWYLQNLKEQIVLPGSMTTNNKGNDVDVNTPWVGGIVDSSYFTKPEFAKYREKGNIKVPFWLQPIKYYKGAACYQKKVSIPKDWKNKPVELYLERCHWETQIWIDGTFAGMRNSLGTAHVVDLSKFITPGEHTITIRVDNRVKDIDVGQNSHSISDHTQGNWNGIIGKMTLTAKPDIYIDNVQVYPDIHKKQATVEVTVYNSASSAKNIQLQLQAAGTNGKAQSLKQHKQDFKAVPGANTFKLRYAMGDAPLLWNEFTPNLYSLNVAVTQGKDKKDEKTATFGMREFKSEGTQFTINGNLTFLRGTLECAEFPKTGFPPIDEASWTEIFAKIRSYGLNHVRFHSWCPPEAAFTAADKLGFYLQIECSSWANQGAVIGDGKPLDKFIYQESADIVKDYGNHPSFCMMTYGNEPAGKNHVQWLTDFVKYWQAKDARRLYTTGAGWPVIAESDYNSTPDPRIQQWGQGTKSIINSKAPSTDYDWADIIKPYKIPTVSHEIGQWCVYPDFNEVSQYDGILKAKNFEIFKDKLQENGLGDLGSKFLYASGKLQALCYKADIEAALRTKGFAGFQLLGLYDFPGQGTALVGVLNPFWKDKGYITATEYSHFCNDVVPLARFKKLVFLNNESMHADIEIAQFSAATLTDVMPEWQIKNDKGTVLFKGQLDKKNIPLGNTIPLGAIQQDLSTIKEPAMLTLTVKVKDYANSWDFFVYPAQLTDVKDVYVTHTIDDKAKQLLNKGGKVLLTLKKDSLAKDMGGDIAIGFSSIFWNTAWTGGQPPVTLGILCDPKNPALAQFPTQEYSNFQWQDAMSHSGAIELNKVAKGLQPIVRVIDDWVTARSLGIVFECKVGNGKLMVSGIDLLTDAANRPEAKQLLYSLKKYMAQDNFKPSQPVDINAVMALYKK